MRGKHDDNERLKAGICTAEKIIPIVNSCFFCYNKSRLSCIYTC